MFRKEIRNFRIFIPKYMLGFLIVCVTLIICIIREDSEGNVSSAPDTFTSRVEISYNSSQINSGRFESKEFRNEDYLDVISKMEKRRIKYPPQPKHLIDYPKEAAREVPRNVSEEKELKKILYWNDFEGSPFMNIGFGRTPFLLGECKYNNCFATAQRDRYDADEVDALVWYVRGGDVSLPKTRFPNASYIFLNVEPVVFLFADLNKYKDIFDLTFTHREDSDIPYPYNEIAMRNIPNESYYTADFSVGKKKIAAWFVTNCKAVSGRNKLVKMMMKYTAIDVYGPCGNLKCGSRQNFHDCYKMVEREYFFYLSFENSICKDYITEKLFNPLSYEVVPVVYGYGPYWKHAPPNSYIDVFDFTSVKELTHYLIHLSKTPDEYNKYFRWKRDYFVLPRYSGKMHSICKLCEVLNTPKSLNASRYDLQEWFVKQSKCKDSKDPIISSFLSGRKLSHSYNQIRCFIDSENC